jgi:hypothetical protein
VHIGLVLLTNSTTFDVLSDPFLHVRPLITILDGPIRYCHSWVSGCQMIIMIFEDLEFDHA